MIVQFKQKGAVVPTDDRIAALVEALDSGDGVERRAARLQLEEIGPRAVPVLLKALRSPSEHVRWEAAKALGKISDPRAAPALVTTLEDERAAVRWLAATALIKLGRNALVPLLRGLEGNSDSIWFRDGAHHVLHSLVREGVADEASSVLEALENIEPSVGAPIAAYHVLQELRSNREESALLAQ
jgi:hypothetical protein